MSFHILSYSTGKAIKKQFITAATATKKKVNQHNLKRIHQEVNYNKNKTKQTTIQSKTHGRQIQKKRKYYTYMSVINYTS